MEKKANIGFFFQRGYYDGLKDDMLDNNNLSEPFFNGQNNTLIESSKIKINLDFGIKDVRIMSFELKTIYPGLVTGIGMVHETGMLGETKLGMAFEFTSGLPFIPGSSVKGLLRSMFPISSSQNVACNKDNESMALLEEKRSFICDVLKRSNQTLGKLQKAEVDELAKMIFEGMTGNNYQPIYERDIFFDAQIKGDYQKKGFLGFDYITPHKDEFKDPNPIKFLKILPEVTFVFLFRLGTSKLSSGLEVSAQDKLLLFKKILTTIGIGAKTNVGYGQLKG